MQALNALTAIGPAAGAVIDRVAALAEAGDEDNQKAARYLWHQLRGDYTPTTKMYGQ